MKYKNSERTVLASNVIQILGMFLTAVLVPLFIGFEKYGKFGMLFALPATLSVFFHSFYLETANRYGFRRVRSISLSLGFCGVVVVFFIQFLHLELLNAVFSASLFYLMHERLKWECVSAFGNSHTFVASLVKIDLIIIFTNVAILFTFYFLDNRSYIVPLLMVSVQMLVGWLYHASNVIDADYKEDWRLVFDTKFYQVKWAFARAHEEMFITLMPMVVGVLSTLTDAGYYRVTASVMKLSFKALPYRQDLLIAESKSRSLNLNFITKHIFFVLLFSIVASIFLVIFSNSFASLSSFRHLMHPIILCSCLVAFVSIFGPLMNSLGFPLNAVSFVLFGITAGALAVFGLTGFYISFAIAHVFLTVLMFRWIKIWLIQRG